MNFIHREWRGVIPRARIEIAWPAAPSVRWRSEAIGLRMLTGMNSEAIRVETHNVRASTAAQPERFEPLGRRGARISGESFVGHARSPCDLFTDEAVIGARKISREAARVMLSL